MGSLDTRDMSGQFDSDDIRKNSPLAAIGYIPVLFLIPAFATQSPFAKFHANQGLILTIYSIITFLAAKIIGWVIGWIPVIGWIVSGLISIVLGLSVLALIIIGIVNAVGGKAKELPVIGGILKVF